MREEKETRQPYQADAQQAERLEQLIQQRQQDRSSNADTPEAALINTLVQLAATTEPMQPFVAQLEQQLQQQFHTASRHRSSPRWQSLLRQASTLWQQRRGAVAVILLGALLAGFTLSPTTVRATLWDWLYGFGLIDARQVAEQPIELELPAPAPEAFPLSLPEIIQAAPFPVQPPTNLPAGLFFTGGFVMPTETSTQVTLAYHLAAPPNAGYAWDAPLLLIAISDGPLPNRPLVAEGYQQPMRIGRAIGIYTQGTWQLATEAAMPENGNTFTWNPQADAAWLTWQANQLNYLLYAQGLEFTAEELVRIAEAME
ncbi:MAG: hypothetical protein KF832_10170 [Caldilineaceae bacterium]|nr:hypothetical protein [Caldilineaceae bacterium]